MTRVPVALATARQLGRERSAAGAFEMRWRPARRRSETASQRQSAPTGQARRGGQMKATIAQFPGKMAARGVEAAANAVKGKPVEPFIDTGTQLVTTDNAGTFLTFQ